MTRLEFLRRNHPDGLSQTDLATRMGVGQTLISSMERGMRPGDPKFLRKLAKYFGVPEAEADSLLRDVAGRAAAEEAK